MVNYLYDLEEIEKNHEAYAEGRTIVASASIKRLARYSALHLLPVPS
jgi:malonyl-CoA decarboxylase